MGGERKATIFPVLQLIITLLPPQGFCVFLLFPSALFTSEHTQCLAESIFAVSQATPGFPVTDYLGSNNHIQTLHDFCLFK